MTDSLTVFGTDYTGVTGIKATGTGNGTLTYIRPTGNIAITSNTASGSSLDVSQYATATVSVSGGGNTFVVTVSWNSSTELWEPDCTFAEVQAAYAAGKNIVVDASGASEDATADGEYDSTNSRLRYWVHQYDGDAGVYETPYDFNSSGATRHSATVHYITPTGSKSITSNGTNIDVAQYATVDVAVPSGQPNLQAKTNIAPSTSSQTITADNGYDGLSSVQINAMPSGSVSASATKGSVSNHAISVTPTAIVGTAGYLAAGSTNGTAVTVSASELVSGTYSVTSSGTKDVTNYASASVPSGSLTVSASKGTVSNHSVSVTPSVTVGTAGFVSSGANGTAVTVSASELVSGNLPLTANTASTDCTNYATVSVAIPIVTYYTSTSAPTSSQGSNNDIWLKTVS